MKVSSAFLLRLDSSIPLDFPATSTLQLLSNTAQLSLSTAVLLAQLAVIGYLVPELYKFPGEIAPGNTFDSIPNGVAAINAIPALGWLQMAFLIGSVDYYGFLILGDTEGKGKSAEELATAKTQELQHGRLAMIAILELLRHDSQMLIGGMYEGDKLITGLPFLYQ